MAFIQVAEQTTPGSPSSGNARMWPDSTTSKWINTDDAGRHFFLTPNRNWSTADQAPPANTDTYITGSSLLVPSVGVQAGTRLIWRIEASKTAAGTAAAVWQVRIGANQTTADTSRLTITQGAQSAVADTGIAELVLTVRSVSASGVIRGGVAWAGHHAAAVGFGNAAGGTSAGFDNSALGGSTNYIGLSVNTGASAAWTITQVQAEMAL